MSKLPTITFKKHKDYSNRFYVYANDVQLGILLYKNGTYYRVGGITAYYATKIQAVRAHIAMYGITQSVQEVK